MNRHDDLDRMLQAWLDDPYTPPAPHYLPEVLEQTRRIGQRPTWASLERWLPMTIILRRPLLSPPIRLLAVGLAILLAVGAAVGAGALLSHLYLLRAVVTLDHPRGLIAFERDDAVWTYDPETAATERVVDDAHVPTWSPDGRSLFFWRPDGALDMPMVLDMTTAGAAPVALTDTPLFLAPNVPLSMSWGPDGTLAATINVSGLPSIALLRAGETATGPLATIPGVRTDSPAFLPEAEGTRGSTLLYRARSGIQATLETIDPTREPSAPSTILSTERIDTSVGPWGPESFGTYDLLEPEWAPPAVGDAGTLRPIAYHQLHELPPGVERAANGGFRVHVFDGTDRVLVGDADADDEGWPLWDPTGERVAFLSYENGTDVAPMLEGRLVIMPADGDPDRAVITAPIVGAGAFDLEHAWSPDGTQLLLVDYSQGGQVRIVDAATGTMELLPITSDAAVSWVLPAE